MIYANDLFAAECLLQNPVSPESARGGIDHTGTVTNKEKSLLSRHVLTKCGDSIGEPCSGSKKSYFQSIYVVEKLLSNTFK